MKTTLCLSTALSILLISGCFASHSNDEHNDDQADGGNQDTDGLAEKPDNKESVETNVEKIFELSTEEGAEVAADLFCSFIEKCGTQRISCEVSSGVSASDSGGSPQEMREEVHCEVRTRGDSSFDDCQGELTVTIQRGLECAEPSSQQERAFKECLLALNDGKCIEITDEVLREYEAAIARGDDSDTIGSVPEACLRLEEVFDCANEESESMLPAIRCEPGQYAQCTCSDGQKGIQNCLLDRTYSPCECWQGDTTTVVSTAGAAGSAVPVTPVGGVGG